MYPNSRRDFKAERQVQTISSRHRPSRLFRRPERSSLERRVPHLLCFPPGAETPPRLLLFIAARSYCSCEAAAGRKHAATRPSILRPSALPANAAPPSPFVAAPSPSRFPSTQRRRTIPTLPAAGSRASSPRGGVVTLKWYIRLGLSATNLLCPCSQRASHKDDKALVLAAANTPLLLDWVENICQLFMCPILKPRNACSRSISAAPLTALGKPISRAWLQRN